MYQKYNTEALVLGNREQGESDRVFALYTEEFGLVRARSSAVRSERSRMRYALQNYSRASVALLCGKHGWRIGGAISLRGTAGSGEHAATFARIARLVLRLVAGEEQNYYLFAVLREAHDALAQSPREVCATIELVCVARVLFALGYLSADAFETTSVRQSLGTGGLFTHAAYAESDLQEAKRVEEKLLSSINHAMAETHL